jgi:hypothetical protein
VRHRILYVLFGQIYSNLKPSPILDIMILYCLNLLINILCILMNSRNITTLMIFFLPLIAVAFFNGWEIYYAQHCAVQCFNETTINLHCFKAGGELINSRFYWSAQQQKQTISTRHISHRERALYIETSHIVLGSWHQ